jgi:very-short-patch-repair endonuclease
LTAYIEIPNLSNLLDRYVAGESENKLAGEAGVNRWTFRRRLIEAGIRPRNQSAAETLKWAGMSIEQRASQGAAAHAATRGREVSFSELCEHAAGRELHQSGIVPVETELAAQLRKAGLDVVQQKAVGPYNLDVAIDTPPVAVEIFGGGWHSTGRHKSRFHKRIEYILDEGWAVVIVWLDARHYPLGVGCTEYIIALAEELRCNPTARREYRVILGNGDAAPIRQSYLNTPADIERFRGGDNRPEGNNLITG